MTDDLRNLIIFWEREEQEILVKLATISDDANSNWQYYHEQLISARIARLVLSKLQEMRDKGPGV